MKAGGRSFKNGIVVLFGAALGCSTPGTLGERDNTLYRIESLGRNLVSSMGRSTWLLIGHAGSTDHKPNASATALLRIDSPFAWQMHALPLFPASRPRSLAAIQAGDPSGCR